MICSHVGAAVDVDVVVAANTKKHFKIKLASGIAAASARQVQSIRVSEYDSTHPEVASRTGGIVS